MAAKTTSKTLARVIVKDWERSHTTPNGNGVYNFVIEAANGDLIKGKTQPGMHQSLSCSPTMAPHVLINVVLDTTPSGRVIMKDAATE